MTQPEEQIKALHDAMKILNRGNASEEDVLAMFKMIVQAVTTIRQDLEKKIDENDKGASTRSVTLLGEAEKRIEESISKKGDASKKDISALRKELKAEIKAVRKSIPELPELPDFQAMLDDLEKLIPEPVEQIEYTAGRNIKIEDRVITNTNPKITVSPTPPSNPQVGDLWVRT